MPSPSVADINTEETNFDFVFHIEINTPNPEPLVAEPPLPPALEADR
jgi:hypothetical protein